MVPGHSECRRAAREGSLIRNARSTWRPHFVLRRRHLQMNKAYRNERAQPTGPKCRYSERKDNGQREGALFQRGVLLLPQSPPAAPCASSRPNDWTSARIATGEFLPSFSPPFLASALPRRLCAETARRYQEPCGNHCSCQRQSLSAPVCL